MRKFLSVILSLILLVTMAVPAFATTNNVETTDTRTVEEILNEYHEKSFAAELAKESENPAGNSRQASSGKSLKQETVDELRAAGYEAYLLTSSNYEALEVSLKTDFDEMGLAPECSYIVVVRGEDSITNSAYSSITPITPPDDSTFTYTYNGVTYSMCYLTITSTDDSDYVQHNYEPIANATASEQGWANFENFCNTMIYYGIDEITKLPISTVLSLMGVQFVDIDTTRDINISLYGTAYWTRTYTLVKHATLDLYTPYSSVDYVKAHFEIDGRYFSNNRQEYVDVYNQRYKYEYSDHYMDYTWRKQQAAVGYISHSPINEYVGSVYVHGPELNSTNGKSVLLFVLWQAQKG